MNKLESIRDDQWNAWVCKHNADEVRAIAKQVIKNMFRDKVI